MSERVRLGQDYFFLSDLRAFSRESEFPEEKSDITVLLKTRRNSSSPFV